MSDFIEYEINGRNIEIPCEIAEKLSMIAKECNERDMDTNFLKKLLTISVHFRKNPDFVLMYLEPILEMVKNNIHPGKAFVLFEEYCEILFNAKMQAKESIKKRMAQENRIKKIYEKRELFFKIQQEYEEEKKYDKSISIPLLLEKHFSKIQDKDKNKDKDKILENLRQQYYRTIRDEGGVKKEQVSDEDFVINEFLNFYLLDDIGRVEREGDNWHIYKTTLRIGKSRSRIDKIINRQKYQKKYNESILKHMKRKK